MNVSSVGFSSSSLTSTGQVGRASSVNQLSSLASSQGASSVSDPDNDGDTHQISPGGQLLSDLQSLRQSNPATLKSLLSQISTEISTVAKQQSANSPLGQFLNNLASKFQNAANTGDLSQLQPPAGGGGRHHHHGIQAYTQAQQTGQPNPFQASSQAGSDSTLSSLFNTIFQQVTQAVSTSATSLTTQ